jgi:hypothetical protein
LKQSPTHAPQPPFRAVVNARRRCGSALRKFPADAQPGATTPGRATAVREWRARPLRRHGADGEKLAGVFAAAD